MKKTILGISIAVCALIFSIYLTGNLQYEFFSKNYVTAPSSSLSPSPLSEISFADIHDVEYGKTFRLRARIAIQGQCPHLNSSDYTVEKYNECMRQAERTLCTPLFEPEYPIVNVEKYGFDSKVALWSKFVVNPKLFPNAKPSWYDGSTELIVTGKKIKLKESEQFTCGIWSSNLFEISEINEVRR